MAINASNVQAFQMQGRSLDTLTTGNPPLDQKKSSRCDAPTIEGQKHSRNAIDRKRKPAGSALANAPPRSKRVRFKQHEQNQGAVAASRASDGSALSRLPVEIWHHIFSFIPPLTLGCLLSVNKLFNSCLDPSSKFGSGSQSLAGDPCALPPLRPDAIWQASRRRYWPEMPAPLKGRSELEMWRICCSRVCQFCNLSEQPDMHDVRAGSNRGPGPKGVAVVFPFFIVSCGQCLLERSVQELDIFLASSMPIILLSGLPMVFLTQENCIIPPHLLSSASDPFQTQPVKVFWNEHLEKMKSAFEVVKGLGSPVAEEWVKGLGADGKSLLSDASRWEKWYFAGGVNRMRKARHGASSHRPVSAQHGGQPILVAKPRNLPKGGNGSEKSKLVLADVDGPTGSLYRATPRNSSPQQTVESRRCSKRLQSTCQSKDGQHTNMEPKRVEKEADFVGLQPRVEAAVVSNAQSCETGSGKLAGAERGETQGPLKAEISAYADEIIRDEWKNGDAVTGKTAPQFAADVLLYVRKRFYAATSPKVNSGKALGKAPAGKPPGGLRAQKLTLEHMRWIFDAKIEPRVACLRKDLFLCSKCQGTKLYGFKSVVQHYAAKHTTTLSAGNVVVNWRAAWPQLSIFDPRPGDHASSWSKPKAPKSTNTKPKSAPRVSLTSAPADPRSVSTHHFREAGTYSQPSNQTASISHSASFGPPATPIKSSCSSPHPHEQEGLYSHPPVLSGPLATQEDLVSRVARDVWDKMGSLVSLQRGYEDIKLCVVIHHVSKSLEQQCDEARQLKVFMMGLRRQDLLIPLRSVGGLSCKTCRESNPAARHRKMGILKLSQHFINKHHGGQAKQPTGKQLDWRVDMIWLPKYPAMKQLPALIRHDKVLSGLIHAALPWIFGNEARAQEPCSLDVAPISRQVAHEGQRHPSSAPANEVSEPSYIGCSTAPSLNAEGFETSARPASLPSKVRIPELHHGNSGHDIPPNSGVIDPSGNQRNTFVGRQYPLGPGDMYSHHDRPWPQPVYQPPQPWDHPAYPNHQAQSFPPAEGFETRQVSDPRGHYLVRRPVGGVALHGHYDPRRREAYRHYEQFPAHNHQASDVFPPPARASSRLASDYEEYDPRTPAPHPWWC